MIFCQLPTTKVMGFLAKFLVNKVYAEMSKNAIAERDQIQKEVASLDKKINNLLDVIEEGMATGTIKNRLNENATEKSKLEESRLDSLNPIK